MNLFKKILSKLPPKKSVRIALAVFLIIGLLGAVFGGIFVRNFVSGMTILNLPGEPVPQDKTSEPKPGETLQPDNIPSINVDMPKPWDGSTRVNLLFMGLDYRDWEAGEIPRTDTMILFTLDPLNNTAGMISIPRDLWVNIPGFEYDKINTAYFLGETWKVPGGGPELAKRTVEELLGVPIQYFAQVDFAAFVSFIDHIDGVKITVPETIKIDPLGDNNTVTLDPGPVTLSGELALAYARARNSEGGDFDRAARQQQIIMGVLKRITDFNLMPKLVGSAPQLYADLSSGINTNLSLNDAIRLALKVLNIPRNEIDFRVISGEYVTFEKSPEGLDILKPIPDKIRLLRDELFSTGAAVGPAAIGSDILELIKIENARVSIRNGSSHQGLATSTAEYFRSLGINVVEETNAEYIIYSQVYLLGSKPYALKYIAETVNIPSNRIFYQYNPDTQLDIIVILGDDWANNNPIP